MANSRPNTSRLNCSAIHEEEMPSHSPRSEEHTSELQSPCNLVCRLLLEKKKKKKNEPESPPPTFTHQTHCRAVSRRSLKELRPLQIRQEPPQRIHHERLRARNLQDVSE